MEISSKNTSFDTCFNVATNDDVTWITALRNQEPVKMKGDYVQLFSVAVSYGGFFLGSGINRTYRGGVVDMFDFCESDHWNLKVLEGILEDIGVAMTEVPRILWCLPGQSVQNLGLADIANDDDCGNMAAAVAVGNKLLSIFVDHDDSLRWYDNDVVFHFPSPQLAEDELVVKKPREKRQMNYDTDVEFDSGGSDFEEEIVDSDYDIHEGDDDPVITEEQLQTGGNFTFSNLNQGNPTVDNVQDSMLEEMVQQVPPPRTRNVHPVPLPDCSFIIEEQSQNVALGGTSAGVKQSIAMQAEAMKMAKLRAYEEKKEATQAEKLKKIADAKQLKSELTKQRKLEAQQSKQEAAEKKKLAAAEKKEAALAAKAKQAEEKKKLAAARLEERAAKAKQAEEKKKLAAERLAERAAKAGNSQA